MRPAIDLSLFQWIDSQTSSADREALLSIREAVCSVEGTYSYLEVGSHLGGSLQPHVIDPRCLRIYSIDPRPVDFPDERWRDSPKYDGNSTERMLSLLAAIPHADVRKLTTFEMSSWELPPGSIQGPVQFAFIDGEHTNAAVTRDFEAVRALLSPASIMAFHDCFVTPNAFLDIQRRLDADSEHFFHFPGGEVIAIVFGSSELERLLVDQGWRRGLPISRVHVFRAFLWRRFPAFVEIARWCKQQFHRA